MSEVPKPKENPEQLRDRWNSMVNEAYWLDIPGEKGEMLGLDNETIAKVIECGTAAKFLQFIKPGIDINAFKLDLSGIDDKNLTILKMLNRPLTGKSIVKGSRAKMKNFLSGRPGDFADTPHSGWQFSE